MAEFQSINKYQSISISSFISMAQQPKVSQGFTITLRHNTLGRTPLDE